MLFDEGGTRKYLIDQMLANQGSDVGKGNSYAADATKKASFPLEGSPSDGKTDYMLNDDDDEPQVVI